MDDPVLFEITAPAPGADPVKCDHCPATLLASMDMLRVRGWIAYDGTSFSGATLKVRICPACRA